jgi:hypothetical protein
MNGAKSIASSFGVNQRGRMDNTAQSFLMSWLVYHDVLAGFSDPERALDGVESHVTASEQLYSDGTLVWSMELLTSMATNEHRLLDRWDVP